MPIFDVPDPFPDPSSSLPYFPFKVDTTSEATVVEDIKYAAKKILSEWRDIDPKDITVTMLSGGTTNLAVSKVSAQISGETRDVVIRVFGLNTELLIDRVMESRVIEILGNKSGLCFKILGRFANGRVEEFMYGRALTYKDVGPPINRYIARKAAEVHKISVPVNQTPVFWNVMMKWLAEAKQISFDDPALQKKYDDCNLEAIEKEVVFIQGYINSLSPLVTFGHNDLTPTNIIWDEENKSITLVDFEYAAYNFRGFDLGNHFCEYAGLDCDWSLYPKSEDRIEFLTSYLSSFLSEEPTVEQVKAIHKEACAFSLGSHLYWGLWGIVQAKHSSVDFDYFKYAHSRFAGYFLHRDEFLAL